MSGESDWDKHFKRHWKKYAAATTAAALTSAGIGLLFAHSKRGTKATRPTNTQPPAKAQTEGKTQVPTPRPPPLVPPAKAQTEGKTPVPTPQPPPPVPQKKPQTEGKTQVPTPVPPPPVPQKKPQTNGKTPVPTIPSVWAHMPDLSIITRAFKANTVPALQAVQGVFAALASNPEARAHVEAQELVTFSDPARAQRTLVESEARVATQGDIFRLNTETMQRILSAINQRVTRFTNATNWAYEQARTALANRYHAQPPARAPLAITNGDTDAGGNQNQLVLANSYRAQPPARTRLAITNGDTDEAHGQLALPNRLCRRHNRPTGPGQWYNFDTSALGASGALLRTGSYGEGGQMVEFYDDEYNDEYDNEYDEEGWMSTIFQTLYKYLKISLPPALALSTAVMLITMLQAQQYDAPRYPTYQRRRGRATSKRQRDKHGRFVSSRSRK